MTARGRTQHWQMSLEQWMIGSSRSLALTVAACVLAAGPIQSLGAQPTAPEVPDSADVAHDWFGRRDVVAASAFVLATAALIPFDSRIANQFQSPDAQSSRFLGRASRTFEAIASPGAYWIGGTLFLAGMATRSPQVADLGLHGTEAILFASVAHDLLKGIAGRARPYMSADGKASDFRLFRGFGGSDYRAFPSGHTSTAFAAASAVTAEVSRWRPKATPYVGTLMFGGAALVALSRMYNNKHWASDVMLGAAIGTFSGWKVVEFHHRGSRSLVERALASASVMPDGQGGFALGWTIAR